jgi:hypothetical protein
VEQLGVNNFKPNAQKRVGPPKLVQRRWSVTSPSYRLPPRRLPLVTVHGRIVNLTTNSALRVVGLAMLRVDQSVAVDANLGVKPKVGLYDGFTGYGGNP